jgi:hypothetical protein
MSLLFLCGYGLGLLVDPFFLILFGALIAGIINEFPGNDTLSQYDCFIDFV